jgi:hypothetical protein
MILVTSAADDHVYAQRLITGLVEVVDRCLECPDEDEEQSDKKDPQNLHSNFFELRSFKKGHHGFSRYLLGLGPL